MYQDTCFLNFSTVLSAQGEFLGLIKVGVGVGNDPYNAFDSDFMLSLSVMVLINTHQGEPPKAGREGEEKRQKPNPPPMR